MVLELGSARCRNVWPGLDLLSWTTFRAPELSFPPTMMLLEAFRRRSLLLLKELWQVSFYTHELSILVCSWFAVVWRFKSDHQQIWAQRLGRSRFLCGRAKSKKRCSISQAPLQFIQDQYHISVWCRHKNIQMYQTNVQNKRTMRLSQCYVRLKAPLVTVDFCDGAKPWCSIVFSAEMNHSMIQCLLNYSCDDNECFWL